MYRHCIVWVPGGMMTDRGTQSTSPEMLALVTPETRSCRKSRPYVLDVFHQKLSLPGPVVVVCTQELWSKVSAPLRAAAIPSLLTAVCPNQGASPPEVQTHPGSSRAAASGAKAMTVRDAALVAVPKVLLTRTEYIPASSLV